ncbi:putative ribonuclease H-like domain-containing protein [Tanacetum coccineum]
MTQKLGDGFEFKKKACFVCESPNHLIKDCNFYENKMVGKSVLNNEGKATGQREVRPVWNNAQRVNHQNISNNLTHPHPRRNFVPSAVITNSGKVLVNTAKQSFPKAAISNSTARYVNTATSRPTVNGEKPSSNGNSQHALKDHGIVDNGCSRHMTGNKAYLSDYQKVDGGFVAFGGSSKGGKFIGKGKIRTKKLYFEDVYFVKELKFNLFSVSQMCNKKNNVLFTKTECVILSPDFKLLDESQVLLKVPRQNNMYSFDLKNVVPSGGLTCLFANATIDESNLWHKRLGYINIKNMNKLVRGNLVKDLPSKLFVNDHTYVACQKGKQHKALCKTKLVSSISQPLQMLHMDLFGPTFNIVLITKPHNKTPYELLIGRPPNLDFVRPFRCHVTILNTLDHLGKFEGKADEGFLVGYSVNSKAFRVFNTRTRKVKENLHIKFLENKSNVAGSGLEWLFDIDSLTKSMNYELVTAGNQTNGDAGIETNVNAGQAGQEKAFDHEYILLPFMPYNLSSTQSSDDKDVDEVPGKGDDGVYQGSGIDDQERTDSSTKDVNTVGPSINTANANINTGSPNINNASPIPNDPNMTTLEDTGIFDGAYDDEDVGVEADLNNLETTMHVSPIPTTRIHKDHPLEQIIRDLHSTPLTRRMSQQNLEELGLVTFINKQSRTKHKDYQNCLFSCFLSQKEPKKMDVKSAFLYGTIEEEVYVCQPLGFEDPQFPDKVYKVFVDNIIFGSTKKSLCVEFEQMMHKRFHMSSIGELTFFLGLQVQQKENGIFISQDKYMADILKKFDFATVKTASTPIETNKALTKDEEAEDVGVHLYRSMIGSLMYLTASRPDIMFAICACARFQVTPKTSHLHAVKRIFRYIKGQPKLGLWYYRDSPFDLEAFSDSDYAGASLDRKYTEEVVNFLAKDDISDEFGVKTGSCEVNAARQKVDGKTIVISESSVRSNLHFNDEDGVTSLINSEILENLALMGYEIIENLTPPFNDEYDTPSHTKKVFSNTRRKEKDFSRAVTPLFDTMLIQQQAVEGKGSGQPSKPQPTPTTASPSHESQIPIVASSSQPQKTQKHRKPKRKAIEISQSSRPTTHIADETVFKESERRSKYSYDSPLPRVNTPGSDEERIEHQDLTDFVPPTPHDSPLLGGHTPGSDEGRPDLNELMDICTKLSNRVLDLEKEKDAQAMEILNLKKSVKKLERKAKSSIPPPKRILYNDFVELDVDDAMENVEGDAEKGGSTAEQITTAGDTINTAILILMLLNIQMSTRPRTTLVIIHDVEEEPRRKAQIQIDEELAQRLFEEEQAQFEREQRIARERAAEQEAKDAALIEQMEDIQARIDADELLAARLQEKERE